MKPRTFKTVKLTPTRKDGVLVFVAGPIVTHEKFSQLPGIKDELIKLGIHKAVISQRKKHTIEMLKRKF